MTFSDPAVAAYVNANFVPAWHNRGPGFFNADLSTERWIFASSVEAYPTQNICTFFLEPNGRVFHYVAGLYGPDLFLRFLRDAVELRNRLFDAKMAPINGGLENARKLHEDRVKDMDAALKKTGEAGATPKSWLGFMKGFKPTAYRGFVHQHNASCLNALREGYDYLGKLHRRWADTKELPALEDIRYSYLWGNPFTEESADAKKIGEPGGEPPKPEDPAKGGAKPADIEVKAGGRLGVSTGIKPPVSIFGGQ